MTAISGPAQENLDFYAGILGLRLVKLTVNFDDPGAYHIYYGDGSGSPGTILTFFPYPDGHPGRSGAGQATVTRLAIPFGSTQYWVDRFRRYEIDFDRPYADQGKDFIGFRAPDGLQFDLVATREFKSMVPWSRSPVPEDKAIGGMESIVLTQRRLGPTKEVLEKTLGFKQVSENGHVFRFEIDEGGPGKALEVLIDPEAPDGRQGHGSVHHIAFRVQDDGAQKEHRLELVKNGLHVSAVMNRDYFKSIYFREPGGILFEIATDPPGFTLDEDLVRLGSSLKLPSQFEPFRGQIEKALPPLELPGSEF